MTSALPDTVIPPATNTAQNTSLSESRPIDLPPPFGEVTKALLDEAGITDSKKRASLGKVLQELQGFYSDRVEGKRRQEGIDLKDPKVHDFVLKSIQSTPEPVETLRALKGIPWDKPQVSWEREDGTVLRAEYLNMAFLEKIIDKHPAQASGVISVLGCFGTLPEFMATKAKVGHKMHWTGIDEEGNNFVKDWLGPMIDANPEHAAMNLHALGATDLSWQSELVPEVRENIVEPVLLNTGKNAAAIISQFSGNTSDPLRQGQTIRSAMFILEAGPEVQKFLGNAVTCSPENGRQIACDLLSMRERNIEADWGKKANSALRQELSAVIAKDPDGGLAAWEAKQFPKSDTPKEQVKEFQTIEDPLAK